MPYAYEIIESLNF